MKKNLPTILLVAGILALVAWLMFHSSPPAPSVTAPVAVQKPAAPEPALPPMAMPTQSVAAVVAVVPTNSTPTNTLAESTNAPPPSDPMDDKIKLGQLWSTNSTNALPQIFSYLTNSDAEVRSFAIEAIKQVGDHNTVAQLEKLAAETQDDILRGQLTQAALFLTIPTLNESMGNELPGNKPRTAPSGYVTPHQPADKKE